MITINGELVTQFTFPGGEVNVRLPEVLKPPFHTIAWLQSSDDIMALFLVQDALKRHYDQGIDSLTIPYLPYARQDRVCNNGEALSKQVFIQMLSAIHCRKLTTFDVHSGELCPAWGVVHQKKIFEDLLPDDAVLAIPDKGAMEKAKAMIQAWDVGYVQCHKERDPKTGKLSGFSVDNIEAIEGKDVWIIDDICDGGGTFLGLAAELIKGKPKSLNLAVTHGIFSKGLSNLCAVFDEVVSTDTYLHEIEFTPSNYRMLEVVDA